MNLALGDNKFINNKLLGGNGKVKLILYQHRDEFQGSTCDF